MTRQEEMTRERWQEIADLLRAENSNGAQLKIIAEELFDYAAEMRAESFRREPR